MDGSPVLDEIQAAWAKVKDLPPLPEAYLRDEQALRRLVAITEPAGPERGYAPPVGVLTRGAGISIYLDADVPPGVLELRWPDGRVEQIVMPAPEPFRPLAP